METPTSPSNPVQNPDAPPLVRIRGLHKTYLRGQERVEALRGVDLDVERGSFLAILGPSGGGKSTLLHMVGGIDRPTSGLVHVAGTAIESASEDQLTQFRRTQIGFVFQFYNLLPSIDALENTALPLLAQGVRRRDALKTAAHLLELVGLQNRTRHKPAQLSGGEQQRVAIARAIAGKPALVLADEPTGDLDAENADAILHLMREFNHRFGITFVVATHNERLVASAGRCIFLRSGRLSANEPARPS